MVNFFLSPAQASTGQLNYSREADRKLFAKATAPIDPPYDGQLADLRAFLTKVRTHAAKHAWTELVTISDAAGVPHNLITHYGQLTIEEVHADAINRYVTDENRLKQNSHQMYLFLMASMADDMLNMVTANEDQYKIVTVTQAAPANPGDPVPAPVTHEMEDGPSLLKLIVNKVYLDTRATVTTIRTDLGRLVEKMHELGSDVTEFNKHVDLLVNALTARGETTQDLLTHLFAAYQSTSDRDFNAWAKQKETNYFEGMDFTAKGLMHLAEQNYLQANKRGMWNKKSPEAEEIVALKAELAQQRQKLRMKIEPKRTARSGTGRFQKRNENNSNSNSNRSKKQNNSTTSKSRDKRRDPEWMLQEPKPGEANKMRRDGKDWIWCPHHKKWGMHEPDDCKVGKANAQQTRTGEHAHAFWAEESHDDDGDSDSQE